MTRRTVYTAELGNEICAAISDGASLRDACERVKVARRTARDWLARHPDFEAAYERARRVQVDDLVDEVKGIADAVSGSDSPAAVQAARLAVDTRKWLAAKLLPQRFGDQLAVTGKDGSDLITHSDPKQKEKMALVVMHILHAALPAGTPPVELFAMSKQLADGLLGDTGTDAGLSRMRGGWLRNDEKGTQTE